MFEIFQNFLISVTRNQPYGARNCVHIYIYLGVIGEEKFFVYD